MKKLILIAMAIGMFAARGAMAQEGPSPGMGHGPGMGGPSGMSEKDREKFGEKLRQKAETMMMVLLADDMRLDEQKEGKFLAAVRTHLRERRDMDDKARKLEKDIKGSLDDKGDGKKDLEAKLKELEKLRENQTAAMKNFEKKLGGFLSVEERARFVIAWPKAQQEVMQRFEQMRDKRKEMGGKGSGFRRRMGGDDPSGQAPQPGPEGKAQKPAKEKK